MSPRAKLPPSSTDTKCCVDCVTQRGSITAATASGSQGLENKRHYFVSFCNLFLFQLHVSVVGFLRYGFGLDLIHQSTLRAIDTTVNLLTPILKISIL